MNDLHLLYRLSDNGYPKTKFDFAPKQTCFDNFLDRFGREPSIHVFIDTTNLQESTREWVNESLRWFDIFDGVIVSMIDGGSSAKSWQLVKDYALATFKDSDHVYFVEDDYLHRHGSGNVLREGLAIADYVSLYDHADKYLPANQGGNKFIDIDGGEVTKVFRTPTSHWKLTNSTTMTFATSVQVLRQDEQIWNKWTAGSHPNDFQCFLELRERGRSLVTPLPGFSTHCEPAWASPGINWYREISMAG